MRRALPFLLVLFATAAPAQLPAVNQLPTGAPALQPNPSATQFTFAVAGDNRPDKKKDGLTKPLLDIVTSLSATPPAFVLWNGDSVYGKSHKGIKKEYADFLAALKPLPVPFFNTPGNHEMAVKTEIPCGKKQKDTELPDFSGAMLDDYEKSMAGAYGMFRYGNAAFLLINTDDVFDVPLTDCCGYNGFVGQTQLTALTTSLGQLSADPTVQHIFLFMHRPIHDDNSHQIGLPKKDATSAYGKQVQAFRKTIDKGNYPKLRFVFASHDHRLFVYPTPSNPNGPWSATSPGSGKPTFIVTGGAGAPLSGCKNGGTGNPGAYYHYLTVAVNGATATVTVNPLYGTKPCTQPPAQ